jgi:hypothetical protein
MWVIESSKATAQIRMAVHFSLIPLKKMTFNGHEEPAFASVAVFSDWTSTR